ncbi:MAG TPA: RHS repeat domain-containing protein [Candidatus Bathyarchaeia archaeon]|nr:RHS repeat domain-containing protein [Candidatus Bathyarchaeia archaeon]
MVSTLIFLTVLGSIGTVMPGIVHAFGLMLSPSTTSQDGQCVSKPLNATASMSCSNADSESSTPQSVGSDVVQNPSIPRTILSDVSSRIGASGVTPNSPQNLTLYNSAITMRLLGGLTSHDELLAPDRRVLSAWSFWGVEVAGNGTGGWIPLIASSSSFSVVGTNRTGSYVIRSLQLKTAQYSGSLEIAYKAMMAGPLKWDLKFSPATNGHYRLVYEWLNTATNSHLDSLRKNFRVTYPTANFTFSWADVPSTNNVTASLVAPRFSISIDLGQLVANSKVLIDPSMVASTTFQGATQYPFQRKIIYDPKGGYYFVFYSNGSAVGYSASHDGNSWSPMKAMPSGWPSFLNGPTSLPSVAISGQRVVVAAGDYLAPHDNTKGVLNLSVRYAIGTVSGGTIAWGATRNATAFTYDCGQGFGCTSQNFAVRFVYAMLTSNGDIAFAYNVHWNYFGCSNCESVRLYYLRGSSNYTATIESYTDCNDDPAVGVALPEGDPSNGVVRLVYEDPGSNPCGVNGYQLKSVTYSSATNSLGQVDLNGGSDGIHQFSATSDAEYNTHVVYGSNPINYIFHATGSSWTSATDVFQSGGGGPVSPTITVDLSTDTVYVFGLLWVSTYNMTVVMRSKSPNQSLYWYDATTTYQFKNRILPTSLGSTFASMSSTNSSSIALVWSEGTNPQIGGSGFYNVTFGAIPIQTVWSPYAFPTNPWDGSGLAPNGQYSQSLSESVSPSTGALTIVQNDLTVPGRGIDFSVSRVFTGINIPYSQAPVGNGWQLNLPSYDWYNYAVYLSNGQSYRYPIGWNQGSCTPCIWENHQGEHFRLSTDGAGVNLITKSGLTYHFDCLGNCYWRLSRITDATRNNTITFGHSDGGNNFRISNATDTVGRVLWFCYTNGLITSLEQRASGSCGQQVGLVRKVTYSQSGGNLVAVTDPANRATGFQYNGAGEITQVTYSTGWYSSYTYAGELMGTGATGYRVYQQSVYSSSAALIRKFTYSYSEDSGTDQVTRSTVTAYNGTSTQPSAYTDYAFSFSTVKWNVSDVHHSFLRGVIQVFGVQGTIPQETILVTDGSSLGSFTNYYGYDLWGNQIYSRQSINPTTKWSHERFNAYYNDGLPVSFSAFQDSFNQTQGTAPNNNWRVQNGYWMVRNRVFNGTQTGGQQESVFAWSDIKKSDLSLQASVYITRQSNTTAGAAPRAGIFAHYVGSGTSKWGLVLIMHSDGSKHLDLFDEWGQMLASPTCNFITGAWYTFNMTVHGTFATGWASSPGQPACPSVTGNFPGSSPAINGTGFGLYAGGYSTLFANVTATTVSPLITGTGFPIHS